jgi:hypothetical protein
VGVVLPLVLPLSGLDRHTTRVPGWPKVLKRQNFGGAVLALAAAAAPDPVVGNRVQEAAARQPMASPFAGLGDFHDQRQPQLVRGRLAGVPGLQVTRGGT